MWSERVKMNSEVDYYKGIEKLKINCDNMIVNMKFEYERRSCYVIKKIEYEEDDEIKIKNVKCNCIRESVCDKWIYRMNIKSSCDKRSKEVIVKSEVEVMKLNVKYVTLTKKRRSRVNKELKRRIEQMKSIPVLTL